VKRSFTIAKYQLGLSLIELMVAVVLSSLLLLGVVELFANTSRTDRSGAALADMQDDARVAMEFLKRDMRRAGYIGCADPQTGVSGNDFDFPEDGVSLATANSITLNYAAPNFAVMGPSATTASGTTKKYLLTDCQSVALFDGEINGGSVRSAKDGNDNSISGFPSDSHVHELSSITYSLNGDELRRSTDALIGNVSALAFSYGITDAGGTTTWSNSVATSALPDISQVKISLTLTGNTDAAISKTFTTIVQLRNRL
jgi:type IV pilus assembly protein PilW